MKYIMVWAFLMLSVTGCASADTLGNVNTIGGQSLSLSQAKAQVLKDPARLDMLQPFGKFSWDDGIFEVVTKLKSMGVASIITNKAIGETIPIDFLIEIDDGVKYFTDKFDSQDYFSVYPVVVDGIPFELEFFMDDNPEFGVIHSERVVKTRNGGTKALHIEKVILSVQHNRGEKINTESITDKILKKYARFVNDAYFTSSAPRIGDFKDTYDNYFYVNMDHYGYCGNFYKKALDDLHKKDLAEKEKEKLKNLKDMGGEL